MPRLQVSSLEGNSASALHISPPPALLGPELDSWVQQGAGKGMVGVKSKIDLGVVVGVGVELRLG